MLFFRFILILLAMILVFISIRLIIKSAYSDEKNK